MSGILDLVQGYEARRYGPGEVILEQGKQSGLLLVLLEGEVEILRDGIPVARAARPGVLFGEMSVLLKSPHTATVRSVTECSLAVIDRPREFLEGSPRACLEVAELLASRLDALTRYLADVKRQYEGHDHLGMVDRVLETLMHRPRKGG